MIKSLGTYDFPSRSRQELYGDDILVNIWRKKSMFICSAGMVRVPKAMTWAEFVETQVMPYCQADPDFDREAPYTWQLVDDVFTPDPAKSLVDNGIRHKQTVALVEA